MGPSERKSVEPIAAVTAPDRTSAQHQSLLHFVAESDWSDEDVLATVRHIVLPTFEAQDRSRLGLSMTLAFPSRASTPLG
jgi:SRSO17 transposase